jgi:perosamine synthetase
MLKSKGHVTLAINGGQPVSTKPIKREHDGVMEQEEIEAAIDVIKSRRLWLYNGRYIPQFEEEFASYVGAKHAISFVNATCGIEAAVAAAKIGPGDEVITTPFTFIATQGAIVRQNAIPIFADIDPHTYTLDPKLVEGSITEQTKAILCVSIFGHPVDMDPLMKIASENGLVVIDDAAQATGAEYKGRKLGSIADMTIFSFTAPKSMTSAGEGGMVTTNDDALAERLTLLRAFGYDRPTCLESGILKHDILGWNARMTEVQAAVGLAQLRKLDDFNQRRINNACYLTERLEKVEGIVPPYVSEDVKHVFWHYIIRVKEDILGISRDQFRRVLQAEGVESTIQYAMPNYRQPFLQKLRGHADTICPFRCPLYKGSVDYTKVYLPVVEQACKEVLSIPVHNLLTRDELEKVADAIEKVADYYRNQAGP